MNVLIIGGGGREHALAWKLARSPDVKKIYCAPGNAGTARRGENVPLKITDVEGLLQLAREKSIDLTVVGPDDALAAGIVDRFQADGRRIFGPTREAARLEWSKIFTKDFLLRHGIPTAAAGRFERVEDALAFCGTRSYPLVVKADGLATGKGVIIAQDRDAAERAVREMMVAGRFGDAGRRVLIEEFLTGPEISLHALIDSAHHRLLPVAQDYKRVGEGNLGENTGGMGSASPPAISLPNDLPQRVETGIMQPFMAGLHAEKLRFQGLLFPGLMLTPTGPRVLEFNARFGDPETQVILPRLQSDLLPILEATIDGRLPQVEMRVDPRAAVCVILASSGYPGSYETGKIITGLETIPPDSDDLFVFHAGTRLDGENVVTSGGRVLGVTALGRDLGEARDRAYDAADRIAFEGRYLRRDIAAAGAVA